MPEPIFDQRVEIDAVAAVELGDQAHVARGAGRAARRAAGPAACRGRIASDLADRDAALLPDQPERAGPAQPEPLEPGEAAAQHGHREQRGAAPGLQRNLAPAVVADAEEARFLRARPRPRLGNGLRIDG